VKTVRKPGPNSLQLDPCLVLDKLVKKPRPLGRGFFIILNIPVACGGIKGDQIRSVGSTDFNIIWKSTRFHGIRTH
jgi:hypothetical protein